MIDENFINQIPKDQIDGIIFLIDEIHKIIDIYKIDSKTEIYDDGMELYAFFLAYIESLEPEIKFSPVTLTGSEYSNLTNIEDALDYFSDKIIKERSKNKFQQSLEKYSLHFGNGFFYEISDGDLKIIQRLLNELRDIINQSDKFEDEHKDRLLKKLENLQSELHKRMSNLDKFWGLLSDAGVAIKKLGEDAKPIVDRIREIVDIIWRVQSIAEELPSGTQPPLLKSKDDEIKNE